MSTAPSSVVVVGASIAGYQTAQTLRDLGYAGSLVVLGEEKYAPYQRPPLSKAVLAGQRPHDTLTIAPSRDMEVVLGARAVGLDRGAQEVITEDDRRWRYDRLVVATGAHARRLTEDPEELVLRTIDDCLRLRESLQGASSLLIIGGGFLGMEVASTCADMGIEVTVVDRDPALQRLLGAELSSWVRGRARAHGVRLVSAGPGASKLTRTTRGWVYTAGELELHAELAVSAVGDCPNTQWLSTTGLPLTPGLHVDAEGRASEAIFGVGDVSARFAPDHTWQRTPYWSAALEQAQVVAHAVLDLPAPANLATSAGYYWSEQFGFDVRVCGTFPPSGPLLELDGSLAAGSALVSWSTDDGRVDTVAALNHRTPVGRLKRWLGTQTEPTTPASQDARPPQPTRT